MALTTAVVVGVAMAVSRRRANMVHVQIIINTELALSLIVLSIIEFMLRR